MRVVDDRLARWIDNHRSGITDDHQLIDGRKLTADEIVSRISCRQSGHRFRVVGDQSRVHVVTRFNRKTGRVIEFIVNTGDTPARLRFEIGNRTEIPLDDDLPPRMELVDGVPWRTLEPFESVLLEHDEGEPKHRVTLPIAKVAFPNDVAVRPLGPNLLRLGEWEMCLVDDARREGAWAAVGTMPIANQLAASKLPFAPRMDSSFGSQPDWRLPALHVRYRCRFSNGYEGPIRLLVEPHSLSGDWQMRLNDSTRDIRESDLHPTEGFVRGQLGCDLTPFLSVGENTLMIDLHTDRNDGGLLNPLYLAGDFGVDLQAHRLTSRPMRGVFEDYRANGLPHYAGVVEYEATIDLASLPDADEFLVSLDVGDRCDEAMEVSFNGGPERVMLWTPRLVKVARDELRPGRNTVRVRLYTTLIRAFEAQRFDYATHRHVDV